MRTELVSPEAIAVGPYSPGISSDPFVFLSGQTPMDPATRELLKGDVGAQTQRCFDNLFAVLVDAGLDESDVVKVNVYLVDMNDFADMNEVYSTRFTKPYPARTTVAVAALPLGARVEIELVARHRGNSAPAPRE